MDILIIKPSSIGDIIHSLLIAQAIRDQVPTARISWVVRDRFADVVRNCPTVNGDVITFNRTGGWKAYTETCRQIRTSKYDLVLDFQGLLRTGLMALAAHSPRKIGRSDAKEGSRLFYHETVPLPVGGRKAHAVEVLLQFLPALNLKREVDPRLKFNFPQSSTFGGLEIPDAPIVMIPNSRGEHKEWPRFVDLTQALLAARPDVSVVWDSHKRWEDPTGVPAGRFVNLTSRTSLSEMFGLLSRARLVIANDSGPMHIAAALGVEVLGLFGPTPTQRFGPFPLDRATNHTLSAPGGDLSKLAVSIVLDKVTQILDQRVARAA
jgi:ADP-heptose:LPS heptosyltransferase